MHLGGTYREGMPDHLTIHKLITDIPLDQLTSRYEPHLKEPVGECPVPTQYETVVKCGTMLGETYTPAVPQEDDERDQT